MNLQNLSNRQLTEVIQTQALMIGAYYARWKKTYPPITSLVEAYKEWSRRAKVKR